MKQVQHRASPCETRARRNRKVVWLRRAVLAVTYLGISCSFMAAPICGEAFIFEPENPCSLAQPCDAYVDHCRTVRINEIEQDCSADDSSQPDDWVELYNSGPDPVDISGWMLISIESKSVDEADQWKRVIVGTDTVLQPGEFEVMRGFGNWLENSIARICLVASDGLGSAFLVDAAHACGDGVVNPYDTLFVGDPHDSQQEIEWTWQRIPDGGTAAWRKLPATPGIANQSPDEGMFMVVSQERCHQDSARGPEFVTLLNLFNTAQSIESWTLRWGADPSQVITLPEHEIQPSESLRIYTGAFAAPAGDYISLGNPEPIWSEGMPDVIELRKGNDWLVACSSYWTNCSLELVLRDIPPEALR